MRSAGAAHKNQKRRRIVIALRAIVISSKVERSLLQNGQLAKETLIALFNHRLILIPS